MVNVLSLFDGMSCGQIALNRLGIKINNYFASEIDKYAIEITQKNYPNTIQVGDISKLDPKDFMDIDLILAGSPCQGFSFAGKQLAFDDPRSALFFEFIRLLKAIKPKYFLLENVKMKKEHLQIISEQVSACYPEIPFGIEPIFINSSLVSAQSRQRYYWTNIPNITQPEERGIVLRDILEEHPSENPVKDTARNQRHYKNLDENLEKMTTKDGKAFALTTTYGAAVFHDSLKKKRRSMIPTSNKPEQIATAIDINGHDILKRVYSPDGKSPTVNTCQGGNREPKVVAGAWRGRYQEDGSVKQKLHLNKQSKSYALTATFPHKMNFLTKDQVYWRKLTPLECERLQTVPDNYTEGVSNTQRYKMLGNGWTVDVIAHILGNAKW